MVIILITYVIMWSDDFMAPRNVLNTMDHYYFNLTKCTVFMDDNKPLCYVYVCYVIKKSSQDNNNEFKH